MEELLPPETAEPPQLAPRGLGPSRPDAMGPKSLWQVPSGPRRAVKRVRSEESVAVPPTPAAAPAEAPATTAPPPPGSRITVRFSDGKDYAGTVTGSIFADGQSATVQYDDGQSEAVRFPDPDIRVTRVGPLPPPSLEVILSTPAAAPFEAPAPDPAGAAPAAADAPAEAPAAPAPATAEPTDAESTAFGDGDRVEARFGFGKQWYGGRITGGSALIGYDLVYDDGDRESGVAAEMIRPIIREFVELPPAPVVAPRPELPYDRAAGAVGAYDDHEFVGIYRKSKTANWEAGIKVEGERMHLGTFASPALAAAAYDAKARTIGRAVNFPRAGEQQAKKQRGRKRAKTVAPASPPQHILFGSPQHVLFGSPPEAPAADDDGGFVGIWRAKGAKTPTWKTSITIDGGKVHLGSFGDPTAAAQAYDARAREQGRPVNFPRDGEAKAEKKQRAARADAAPSPRAPAPSPRAPRVSEVERLRRERDVAMAQLARVRGQLDESRRQNDKLLAVFSSALAPPPSPPPLPVPEERDSDASPT